MARPQLRVAPHHQAGSAAPGDSKEPEAEEAALDGPAPKTLERAEIHKERSFGAGTVDDDTSSPSAGAALTAPPGDKPRAKTAKKAMKAKSAREAVSPGTVARLVDLQDDKAAAPPASKQMIGLAAKGTKAQAEVASDEGSVARHSESMEPTRGRRVTSTGSRQLAEPVYRASKKSKMVARKERAPAPRAAKAAPPWCRRPRRDPPPRLLKRRARPGPKSIGTRT